MTLSALNIIGMTSSIGILIVSAVAAILYLNAWQKMKKTPIVFGVAFTAVAIFVKHLFIAGIYFHKAMGLSTHKLMELSGVANLLVFSSCVYFVYHSVKTPDKKIMKELKHKH